jgi:hypothetical protein
LALFYVVLPGNVVKGLKVLGVLVVTPLKSKSKSFFFGLFYYFLIYCSEVVEPGY